MIYAGPEPPVAFGPALNAMGTFSILTLPGDNDTWSLTLFTAASDVQLKALKEPEKFTKVVRACPLQQHWLDGEPISEVLPDGRDHGSTPAVRRRRSSCRNRCVRRR